MHAIYCEDNDLKCQVGSLTVLEVQFMSQVIKIILTIKFTKYRSRWGVQGKKKKKENEKERQIGQIFSFCVFFYKRQ